MGVGVFLVYFVVLANGQFWLLFFPSDFIDFHVDDLCVLEKKFKLAFFVFFLVSIYVLILCSMSDIC